MSKQKSNKIVPDFEIRNLKTIYCRRVSHRRLIDECVGTVYSMFSVGTLHVVHHRPAIEQL